MCSQTASQGTSGDVGNLATNARALGAADSKAILGFGVLYFNFFWSWVPIIVPIPKKFIHFFQGLFQSEIQ